MIFDKKYVPSVLLLLLALTLPMPYILVPNTETLTMDATTGFQFFADNILILFTLVSVFIVNGVWLKSGRLKALVLFELMLTFFLALLSAPVFYQGFEFFIGVKSGYYSALVILIVVIVYCYRLITVKLRGKD